MSKLLFCPHCHRQVAGRRPRGYWTKTRRSYKLWLAVRNNGQWEKTYDEQGLVYVNEHRRVKIRWNGRARTPYSIERF